MVNSSLYVWNETRDVEGSVSWARMARAITPAMKKMTSEVIM